ncbi:MAG: SRPBCC family protein [Planctomycetota bacterium]
MQIYRDITIQAPTDRVWRVLGEAYADIGGWMSAVHRSSPRQTDEPIGGAPVGGRVCETDLGPVVETITEYDAERHVVAYNARAESMPSFVIGLANRWSLTGYDDTTFVEMRLTMNLKFPFGVMSPLMRIKMGPVLTHAVEELKHYVETGEPHPRKLEAMGRAQASPA